MTFTVTVAARAKPRVNDAPCCDEPDKAPIDQELADLINALRPPRQ